MKVCIGIICIGQQYLKDFEATVKPSVDTYAKKYGYDLKVFTDFLDSNHRHPDYISFEKCLVPRELKEYDCVIVMDADIYIHEYSPPIHTLLTDKIGIVNEVGQVSPEQYKALGFASEPTTYYSLAGFNLKTEKILNTGLFVCNPSIHSSYLEEIYNKYIDKAFNHPRRFHYEQACIGYELQISNMFSLLPNTWNYIYMYDRVAKINTTGVYFIHFAGMGHREVQRYLATYNNRNRIRWGKNLN